tara:strand:+ start:1082 stop:1993 length:912 start_codon:yes stop_codon:yes gene_type:complete
MENINYQKKQVTLNEMILFLWQKKIKISTFTLLISLISLLVALNLSDVYRSEAVLAPTEDSKNANDLSQFSGLANLTGINLLSNNGSRLTQGIEIMNSLSFFESLMSKNNLFFEFLAPKGWDPKNNKLQINSDFFDENKNTWVYSGGFSKNGKPSIQYAHREFLKKFSVKQNNRSGLVALHVEHFSPFIAQKIAILSIEEINSIIRMRDIEIAKNSIKYLEIELENLQTIEVRSGIYRLIQKQIETIAIANATPEYVFTTLSAPTSPELKIRHSSSQIILTSTILAFIFICSFYLIRKFYLAN